MFTLRGLRLTGVSLLLLSSAWLNAVTVQEDFADDPAARGWQRWGHASLFQWNPTERNLTVTWDSRMVNSYCYRPLGTVLGMDDSFHLSFELRLTDFTPGIDPAKAASPFQISAGLIRLADATAPDFVRGSGTQSPNLIEFSFFPDPGGTWEWGPSLTTVLCDRTGLNWSSGGFAPSGLTTNAVFRIVMTYDAARRVMATVVLRNGEVYATPSPTTLGTNFTDFRVDAFAFCSYNDNGQWPGYEGSILAHGAVDNVEITLPEPPITVVTTETQAGRWGASFNSRSNWFYTLEASADLAAWRSVSPTTAGTGGWLSLTDTNAPRASAFYRVFAERP